MSASETKVYGATTVNGKTEFKADVQAPKITADNLEANTSFKSSNISDGIPIPGAPSTASLSAKLKEADAPEPKEKKTADEKETDSGKETGGDEKK